MEKLNGILVLGAGELGLAILKALAGSEYRQQTPISVLLRQSTIETQNQTKREELGILKDLGIALVPGDLIKKSVDELAHIFSQYEIVIGCTGMVGPPGTQMKIAAAALASKTRKYIPWQWGVDYDSIAYNAADGIFNEQMDVRTMLRSQKTDTPVKWIIISTGMFMSFIFDPSFGIVSEDRRSVHALGSWENQVTLTDVSDIGAVTARIIFGRPEEPELFDQVVFCAGETIQYRKVLEVLEAIGARGLDREAWTVERLRNELDEDPSNQLKRYRLVFAEGNGLAWDESTTFNAAKGMEMMKLQDWARQNIQL